MEFDWYRVSSLEEKTSPAEKTYFGELAIYGEKIMKVEKRLGCSRWQKLHDDRGLPSQA